MADFCYIQNDSGQILQKLGFFFSSQTIWKNCSHPPASSLHGLSERHRIGFGLCWKRWLWKRERGMAEHDFPGQYLGHTRFNHYKKKKIHHWYVTILLSSSSSSMCAFSKIVSLILILPARGYYFASDTRHCLFNTFALMFFFPHFSAVQLSTMVHRWGHQKL